jgi:hypothetical protein
MRRDVGGNSRDVDACNIVNSGEAQDFLVSGEASESVRVQRGNQCGNGRNSTENGQLVRSLLEESWEEIDDSGSISGVNAADNGGGISETFSSVETIEELLEGSLVRISCL